jgi:hypothetical protein
VKRLKRLLPNRIRLYLRRLGRLRWITKARTLRSEGAGAWEGRPLRQARYVLLDPEVDTYTYPVANVEELSADLAEVLDRPTEEVDSHLHEALEDPELGAGLAGDIGWRVLYLKRRPALPSHHLSAWAIIRTCKPRFVVETGILEGLGSRTMLRALELNAEEGAAGRLMSFDVLPGAGVLVPERLRERWQPVYEHAPEALVTHLEGHEVDLFLHDSTQEADHLRAELDAVTPHLAPCAVLMTLIGWSGVLEDLAARVGARCRTFRERPADHFYAGRRVSWMRLRPPPAPDAAPGPTA